MPSSSCTVVRPGGAEGFWVISEKLTPLLSGDQTKCAYDFVSVHATPNGGPPPHLHRGEDEIFYIVKGSFAFVFDDKQFTAGAGSAVFLPRGIVHTYNNIGTEAGQLLVTAMPSNFARFIQAAGFAEQPQIGPAVFEKLQAACAKFDLEIRPDHKAANPAPPRAKERELWVASLHIKLLLTRDQTAGQFSVAEITGAPGTFVPPHWHNVEDEMFYVTEGEFEFQLEGDTFAAPAGTFIHVPKQTLHGFRNASNAPAKLVDYHTPGGFERFFEDAGTVCVDVSKGPPSEPLDIPKFIQICERHGMTVPPPPQP